MKIKCDLCGQEISNCNYSKHLRRHKLHPETFLESKWKIKHGGLTCQFCGKECKNQNSLCNHERQCKSNPNRQTVCHSIVGFNNFGRQAWNKGLKKEDDIRIELASKKISERTKGKLKHYTEEQISNLVSKGFETKRKNNTLNSSKVENDVYFKLLKIYSSDDIIRHFKDERYPYECDFYIKSLDLFIEINFHWTHGEKPFNNRDISCQQKLNDWENKAKKSKYFLNAIDVWTRRDVIKLETAKKNNLNYITIYNYKDLNRFIGT